MEPRSVFKDDVLSGKVALLTGGGSGIGLEIATTLGKHGAKVALMGRRKNVLDEAVKNLTDQGIQAIRIAGDVRKNEDCIRAVSTTADEFGKLDILVNAAAGNFLCAAEDLSPNGFKTVMDIDTNGTFQMCLASLHYLKKGGKGKAPHEDGVIINISATLHYSATWYQIHVSAAKAAIDSITRSLALEWGTDFGIRVNGIAPGPISDTPGLDKLLMDQDVGPFLPLKRFGDKRDVANAAVFLVSDAGSYITGATIAVDGGSWLASRRQGDRKAVKEFSSRMEKVRKAALTQSKL